MNEFCPEAEDGQHLWNSYGTCLNCGEFSPDRVDEWMVYGDRD